MISRELDVVKPNGERIPLQINISAPVYEEDYDAYGCQVSFIGWLESPSSTIKGEDSYQSLLLALQLVHSILMMQHKNGVRYRWRGLEDEYDLAMFLALPLPNV